MSEWWTYRLSDFLLFSPRTYDRLIEAYNRSVWPAQIAGLVLVLVLFGLGFARRPRVRVAWAVLTAAWAWVAIAFLARRFSSINWAASYFAWAFGLEAAILGVLAAAWGRVRSDAPGVVSVRVSLAFLVFAAVGEPLAAPLLGRGWIRSEVFGVMPDPTVLATLGVLGLVRFRGRWALFLVPILWCAISGATLFALKSPLWWIPPAAAVFAFVALAVPARRKEKGAPCGAPG